MHVVAMKPQFLDGAAVPRELMEEQRAALADKQARRRPLRAPRWASLSAKGDLPLSVVFTEVLLLCARG